MDYHIDVDLAKQKNVSMMLVDVSMMCHLLFIPNAPLDGPVLMQTVFARYVHASLEHIPRVGRSTAKHV